MCEISQTMTEQLASMQERALASSITLNNQGVYFLNNCNSRSAVGTLDTASRYFQAALKAANRSVCSKTHGGKKHPRQYQQLKGAGGHPLGADPSSPCPMRVESRNPGAARGVEDHMGPASSSLSAHGPAVFIKVKEPPRKSPAPDETLSAAASAAVPAPRPPSNTRRRPARQQHHVCTTPVKLLAQGDASAATAGTHHPTTEQYSLVVDLHTRARVSSLAITFNLALTLHLSSSSCAQEESRQHKEAKALSLYRIALDLLTKKTATSKRRRTNDTARAYAPRSVLCGPAAVASRTTGVFAGTTIMKHQHSWHQQRGNDTMQCNDVVHHDSQVAAANNINLQSLELSILNNMTVLALTSGDENTAKRCLIRFVLRMNSIEDGKRRGMPRLVNNVMKLKDLILPEEQQRSGDEATTTPAAAYS